MNSGPEQIEHDSTMKQRIKDAITFSVRVGGVKVSEPDMGTLFEVIARGNGENPEYSPDEQLVFNRLRVDPTLIPYAFKAVPAAKPPIDIVIAQLYNGVAKRERDLEQACAMLPSNMDATARNTTQALLRRTVSPILSSDKVDAGKFILNLNSRSKEMLSQASQQVSLTEADVLDEYLGLLLPPFKDLLSSRVVTKTFDGGTWDPIVTLNPKILVSLPSWEFNDVIDGVRIVHGIEINGHQYSIDRHTYGYTIRHDNFSLRLDGNNILLHLYQIYQDK